MRFLLAAFTYALLLTFKLHCEEEEEEFIPPDGYTIEELFPYEDETLNYNLSKFAAPTHKYAHPNLSENNHTLATLEAGPSAIVADCVSAISGDFFDTHIDLTSCGPQPIVIQRTYSSSVNEWHFQHMPFLEVGSSQGEHHLLAGYHDDNGSGMMYQAHVSKTSVSNIRGHSFTLPKSIFRKGLTNCGAGEICGRTNWKNSKIVFLKKGEDKFYLLRHGSRVDRIFSRAERAGKHHKKGASLGEFHLEEEKHPNGNSLQYSYSNENLNEVKAVNRSGEVLEILNVAISDTRMKSLITWSLGNRQIQYLLDEKKKRLRQVLSTHSPKVQYVYDEHDRLTKKILPEGRFLKIHYYDNGKNKGRVWNLSAPVGSDETPIVTHTFAYEDGNTHVKDAEGYFTVYSYDPKDKRLKQVVRYDENKKNCLKDQFYWGDNEGINAGNLISRVFSDDEKTYFCRKLEYDSYGNVTKDQLYGNLSGHSNIPLIVDAQGKPQPNGCEAYVKTYLTTQNGWNLPLEESDNRKWLKFSYYQKSNLLKHRFTGTKNIILKREFFEYDNNGIVVKEMWDDGTSHEMEDLSNVTERHLKVITPRSKAPIGLPEVVEEYYLDKQTHTYILLKKNINVYSEEGHLLQEKHFDQNEKHAFTLSWKYDNFGNITEHQDALGQVTTYNYDENGNKIFEKGPRTDFYRKYTYDFANRLIKEEEFWDSGQHFVTTHRYNHLGQKIATTDIHGHETQYTYDALSRLIEKQFPTINDQQGASLTPKEITHFDALGNAIEKWDANGNCAKTQYTIRGQPSLIQHPDGSTEKKVYTLDGLLACKIDRNGLTTQYTYDALSRITKTEIKDSKGTILKATSATYNAFHILSETDETGQVTHYDYDGAGRKIAVSKGTHLIKYQYDPLGRISKTIDTIDESSERITSKEYDYLDRVIEERIEDNAGNVLKKEQYAYDAAGNRTEVRHFTQTGISTTKTKYTPHNKPWVMTDPIGHLTNYIYDFNHTYNQQAVLKVTIVDPLGNQNIKIHDPLGRISCQKHLNNFGDIIQMETHFYDAVGHRLSTTETIYIDKKPADNVITQWEYDTMGNMIHCTEAKGTPEQKDTRIYYNAYGQKERITTPNGVTINHEYDFLSRLKTLKSETSSSKRQTSNVDIHYTYEYDLRDNILLVHDHKQNTITKRTYDPEGRISSETLANGHALYYAFDGLNRLIQLTLPDQSQIKYIYNPCYLTAIERNTNKEIYTHRYLDYDLAGNPSLETLIGQAGQITHQYDLLMRSISMIAPNWQETVPPESFDPAGNLLKRELIDAQGKITQTYTYDDLYQLIAETGIANNIYTNDSLYNRRTKNKQTYSLNPLNQLLNQNKCQYRYDRNGNLIEKKENNTSIFYTYDALDRLIKVDDNGKTTSYTYDPFHRRLSKTTPENTTHFLYEHDREIGAITNGRINQLRVLGNGNGAELGATVALELDNITYAVVNDPYGNIVSLLDLSGNVVESYRYTAFGEMNPLNGAVDNPWMFCGKRYDPETQFIYFGRRYYAPDIGRWITPDPAGFAAGPNLYAYVHNNPYAYVDPDGQFPLFLLPIALSIAAEYCLPAVTAYVGQYAGGMVAAGFLTGLVKGYNGSVFEPSTFSGADMSTYVAERAGMVLGTVLAINPTKVATNVAGKFAIREAGAAATTVVSNQASKVVTWFNTSTKRLASPQLTSAAQKTTQIAENQIARQAVSLDKLSQAGQVMDRGGLTRAGRALDKHGGRPGSFFPKAMGNPANKNMQGQFHLDDILTHPHSVVNERFMPKYGNIIDIKIPNNRGVRYSQNGDFIMFLEP